MFGKSSIYMYIYIYTHVHLDYFPIYITYSIWFICSMAKSVLFLHHFHGLHHHHGHGHRERALMPWRSDAVAADQDGCGEALPATDGRDLVKWNRRYLLGG